MSPLKERDPLLDKFWRLVKEEAESRNFSIATGCESYIKEFIQQGVSTLRAKNYGDVSPQDVEKAEEKLRIFVREMIEYSISLGRNELGEVSFLKIKDIFCPGFFPFC